MDKILSIIYRSLLTDTLLLSQIDIHSIITIHSTPMLSTILIVHDANEEVLVIKFSSVTELLDVGNILPRPQILSTHSYKQTLGKSKG